MQSLHKSTSGYPLQIVVNMSNDAVQPALSDTVWLLTISAGITAVVHSYS